jgi:hypothetical protein
MEKILEVWKQYKQAWSRGESPEVDLDTFCDLFSYKEVSVEAVNLVKTSKYARKTLEGAIKVGIGSLGRVFNDSDRIRVWFALRGEDYIDEILINERKTGFGARQSS